MKLYINLAYSGSKLAFIIYLLFIIYYLFYLHAKTFWLKKKKLFTYQKCLEELQGKNFHLNNNSNK